MKKGKKSLGLTKFLVYLRKIPLISLSAESPKRVLSPFLARLGCVKRFRL